MRCQILLQYHDENFCLNFKMFNYIWVLQYLWQLQDMNL